jgi:hypothetical protein
MKFIADLIGFVVVMGLMFAGAATILDRVSAWARAYNAQFKNDSDDGPIIDQ